MASLSNACILLILNDPVSYWCDYAAQTVAYLTKQHSVIVFCSEDTISWKDVFIGRHHNFLFEQKWNALLFHPFFIIPGQRYPRIKQVNYAVNVFFLNMYLYFTKPNTKKIVWFFDPFYVTAFLQLLQRYISVYDCVDYYAGISKQLKQQHQLLLQRSTFVFANSFTLVRKLGIFRSSIVHVPLGFALNLFQKHTPTRSMKHAGMVVGFVGGITRRINFSLIAAVAKKLPDVQFVFYGEAGVDAYTSKGQIHPDILEFFRLKNVWWKGSVTKQHIPCVIASFDICMIPYTTDELFNKYCFPMKIMEYFYVGKPVISTSIEELKQFGKFVFIADSAKEWVRYIKKAMGTSWPTQNKIEQRKIAEEHSWHNKLSKMMRLILA